MLQATFHIDVKSLEDLERVAEHLKIPFIVKKGKTHLVFGGQSLSAPVVYRYKE